MFNSLISSEVISGLPIVLQQVLPEFCLLCLATLVLLSDAYMPRKSVLDTDITGKILHASDAFKNFKLTFFLVNITLVIVFLLVLISSTDPLVTKNDAAMSLVGDMVVNDPLSYILKLFMIVLVFFSFYFSDAYLNNNKMFSGEYYAMGLFSLLGMMVLVSSKNMLTLYLGLELFSLPVYAMIAMQRDSVQAGEAALKYFVMGAIASGILLFGISLVYGLSGSLVLSDIANYTNFRSQPFILAMVFVCVGIAFKFGAAPFHMWMPDLYQGAPTPAALFVSAAPKLAAFGMAFRLLNDGLIGSSVSWGIILQVIALLSIGWGNIAAIAQTSLKRLLAYSGISHMGFILLGIVAASVSKNLSVGYSSALFYVITYSLMSLAAFGFIMMLGNGKYELKDLEDYSGLYHKQPWLALMLMILLFSMAGVPPFVGFFAKMSVIKSLVESGFMYTAVIAVLFTVIGAFYYLRLVWLMFFEDPQDKVSTDGGSLTSVLALVQPKVKLLVSLNCLMVFALGLYSQWLLAWCMSVF